MSDHRCTRIATALVDAPFVIAPAFVGTSAAGRLAAHARALWTAGALVPAAVGAGADRTVTKSVRGDATLWLDGSDTAAWSERYWAGRIETLRRALNRVLYAGLVDWEGHWARYPSGAAYQRHRDVFRRDGRRAMSTVLYLNEAWSADDGGVLRLYHDGGVIDVPPIAGTLVVFDSTVEHEVQTTRAPRLSITGWFRRAGRGA